MKTYLTPLTRNEINQLELKEKFEYLLSFPAYLFLDVESYGIVRDILDYWNDLTFDEILTSKLKVRFGNAYQNISKVKMSAWESKIAKNLKSAMAEIKN
ncbi:hypothetical protein H6G64_35340 [Calothrix sp. FACHB-156]|nr:hypothetical protein [Calothrix sp. FACHB-156]